METILDRARNALRTASPENDKSLAREIARQEIASLCGLVLRRLQDAESLGDELLVEQAGAIFAEALRYFGGMTAEPGD